MVQRFQAAFEAAEEENFIPNGYGMLPEEDEYEVWDPHETVTVARKDVTVTLLEEVWKPRAVRWILGLHLLGLVLPQV